VPHLEIREEIIEIPLALRRLKFMGDFEVNK
jgi:hypothetical protein